ncbi:hypothetical protein ABZY68_25230 [Streptomyces sp. NPDC006482]|uniref:hypothetical protein n=1 Tax=Streptomyces sp. NPDC006482 TaxID=3154306 RepID=UPI0033B23386
MTSPNAVPAYRMSVHHPDGTLTVRECTAPQADALIATALLDDDQVTPDPRAGGTGVITLRRAITGPRNATDPTPVTVLTTTHLVPLYDPTKLTARQCEDLGIVHEPRGRRTAVLDAGRIDAGFSSIPPAATARLLTRGWLSLAERPDGPPQVTVSCAGLIAMAHHMYRISTVTGSAEYVDRHGFDRLGGPITRAWCSCGQWSTVVAADRRPVYHAARQHRLEHLRTALQPLA